MAIVAFIHKSMFFLSNLLYLPVFQCFILIFILSEYILFIKK